jgi:hypothetical protein
MELRSTGFAFAHGAQVRGVPIVWRLILMLKRLSYGVLALALVAPAASQEAWAQRACAPTSNTCPDQEITYSKIQIGGAGSLSSNGLSLSNPARLDDGTIAEADLEFTFDRSAGRLTLVATNQTTSTASLTAIGFNTAPGVTGMALVSHTGSLPWDLAFDLDRTDSVVETHPSLQGLRMDGFGRLNAFIGNKGIDTGGNGGDATEILAGQSVTFVIQVAGDPNGITACSFTSAGSFIPPGDKIVTAVGRFQAGNQGGSGFIGPCTTGDLLVDLASFDVTPMDGAVAVSWETASEVDNAGFAVLRREVRTNRVERLNATLIPGEGSPVSGAVYTFLDGTALNGVKYRYQLEDFDLVNVNTLHPPRRAIPNPPAPPIRLHSPAYEANAGRSVVMRWETDRRLAARLEISSRADFPARGTLELPVGAGRVKRLNPRIMSQLRSMASEGEGGIYWRITGRADDGVVARSDTFFLIVEP